MRTTLLLLWDVYCGVGCGSSDVEILRLCGKSTLMHKEIKDQSSEHFDNQTIGKIVEPLAKCHGYQTKISQ
ncbi:hypothetical protein [Bartonella sp. MR168JLCBS]|uniref:hypothetical protein n=1 Tax=Bartonella sp. MR168JLCBS TaxID=3243556 RepID=UPI00027FCC1E|nr:hypothetical protein RM11_0250 [Bartonella quintana RM-11]